MAYQIVVCVKQVPDTENLSGEAMKEDGTVNRAALPAIVNPEDLNALELALQVKEEYGAHVTALSMGPPQASDALRECLYRGADRAVLVTDRRFAAADTLATSYALKCAVQTIGEPDLVLCGRQAIDGDTAQTGPQLAEKLGLLQFTYVEELRDISLESVEVKRAFQDGHEIVRGPMPALLTVTDEANEPRPPSAKRLMKYKKARAPIEFEEDPEPAELESLRERNLLIEQWDVEDIGADEAACGTSGSATRVKKIDSVRLQSTQHKRIEPTAEGLSALVDELREEHILE